VQPASLLAPMLLAPVLSAVMLPARMLPARMLPARMLSAWLCCSLLPLKRRMPRAQLYFSGAWHPAGWPVKRLACEKAGL
jgi:hypothetical protein